MPDDAAALRYAYGRLAEALTGQVELSVADQAAVLALVSVFGKALLDARMMRRLVALSREVIAEAKVAA